MSKSTKSIVIEPFHYIHVKDENKHTYRVEIGPQNFIRQDHETVIANGRSAFRMTILPERHYCVIEDPVRRNKEDNSVFMDDQGQTKNRNGDFEFRFSSDFSEPFPLYHGEKLKKPPTLLTTISAIESLRIEATRNFTDGDNKRCAGD